MKNLEYSKDLTDEQFGAIRRGINLGRILQTDHPEIADMFREYNIRQIARRLNVESEYGVSKKTSWTSVYYTIAGHDGSFEIEAYKGLIPKKEREEIAKKHKVDCGDKAYKERTGIHNLPLEKNKELGLKKYEKKIGVHKLTSEDHKKNGRKGGKIGGKIGGLKASEKGVGVHKFTPEEKREFGRKGCRKGKKIGGQNSAITRGLTPWTDEEKEHAYQLYLDGNSSKSIAFTLNTEYHEGNEVRNAKAVNVQRSRYKKTLENKVTKQLKPTNLIPLLNTSITPQSQTPSQHTS